MQTSPFSATQPHKLFAWGVLSGLCIVSSHSSSASEVKFSTLYWVESNTKIIDPAMNLQVELTGESFAGQVLQIEQRGLVVYEQSLPEGSFRLLTYPLIADTPLVVKVKSPNQPDKMVDLPIKSSEKKVSFLPKARIVGLGTHHHPQAFGCTVSWEKTRRRH